MKNKIKILSFIIVFVFLEILVYSKSFIVLEYAPEYGVSQKYFYFYGFIFFSIISIIVSYAVSLLVDLIRSKFKKYE